MTKTAFFLRLSMLGVVLFGCTPLRVSINQNYDMSHIKSVAVLDFTPFTGIPESGPALSAVFEAALLGEGYKIVERAQVDKVLSEQHFEVSGTVDPSQAMAIGKILGVDALVFGSVTTYRRSSKSVYLVNTVTTHQEPIIINKQQTITVNGKETEEDVQEISGFKTVRDVSQSPQVYTMEAEAGAVVRMIDTLTGEIIWVGNDSEEAVDTETAAEMVAHSIVKDWKTAVRRFDAQKSKRSSD